MKLESPWQIFEKHSNHISRNSVQWEPSSSVRTDGQTERHDETTSLLSKFCKRD